jgi:DNA-binding NarL/FixJ family response regulator
MCHTPCGYCTQGTIKNCRIDLSVRIFHILIVEDFEPFRRFVRQVLEPRPAYRVVAEAIDGLEAVRKAQELKPDLILLDSGLPRLNGFAAAEQIRTLLPDAVILFISLESSPVAVREALRLGALGYVHKMRAELDLLPAIESVLAGKQFVSSGLDVSENKVQNEPEVQF